MKNFQLTVSIDSSAYVTHISTLVDILLNGSEAELNVVDLLAAIHKLSERVDAYAKWKCYDRGQSAELTEVSATLRALADKIDKG